MKKKKPVKKIKKEDLKKIKGGRMDTVYVKQGEAVQNTKTDFYEDVPDDK